ncbi:MAG: trimethylamine methyltransferase family protein [Candidatus Promineifilaceae bacterium]
MAKKRRKGGGRAARHALRAATNKNKPNPIKAGLRGGQYKPLTDEEVLRIHNTALDVLEQIGMGTPIPELVEPAVKRGAFMKNGRLCYPRALMEEIIAGAAREFTLHARNPKHDLRLGKEQVHYGTGGAAISVLDFKTGEYRDSSLIDIYDFARLCDQLDNVHWFTRSVIASELQDPHELDINTAYTLMAGTQKHVGTAITVPEMVEPVVDLFDIVGGGKGSFAAKPFCKLHTSPIVPPLRYGADASYTILEAIKHNWPINAITAGQSGATSPAALAGTLVQTHAETLAALAMVNIWSPGHEFIFSNWPFVADLRTGSMTGGSAEGGLLNSASAQLCNAINLPSGVAGGMPDSKLPDMQAGYESGIPNVMIGLAGANLIYESSGMLASLLGCSFEAFVINNEIAGNCLRAIRGIEVTEKTLSFDVIKEGVFGAGHFLGADQTIEIMETEYLYPPIGNRMTPMEWKEFGSQDIWTVAREKVTSMMQHYPSYITPEQDAAIRAKFDLKISAEDISPISRRW